MKKKLLLSLGLLFSLINLQAQFTITYTTATTPVSCFGGNDGSATITSITGGVYNNTSTKGLLISEVFANPIGPDSCKEFVELVATRFIDFASTPYTVIFCNNGVATASGWIAGTTKTYAFLINSGSVNAGDVVYVGGSAMIPLTNRIRDINTAAVAGDGGIGSAVAGGVLGNGGANCDGVAVFNMTVASITLTTVPIDVVFFGTGTGTAVVSGGTQGYELPINDYYPGGKLQTTSYYGPDAISGRLIKASFGLYNVSTNVWDIPRTWSADTIANFTNLTTSLLLDNVYNVSWSNSVTSVYNPNLIAGNYSFTITDQLSNIASDTVTLADGAFLALNAAASDYFACEGDLIDLSAQNADIYSWSNGDTTANTQLIVIGDTLAIVMGTDTVLGCSWSDSVFIDVNPYPIINFSMANDTICNDGGNISLNATPIGGTFSGSGVTGSTLDPLALSGTNSVTYFYADSNGCADVDMVNYLVLNCADIENQNENLFNIYPNPATEFLFIATEQHDLQFIIYDMQGKQVRNARLNGEVGQGILNTEKIISVQDLIAGVYVITVYNKEAVKRMKFVKK